MKSSTIFSAIFGVFFLMCSGILYGQGLQSMAEESVRQHIKTIMATEGVYSGFNFADVVILEPEPVKVLNRLKAERNKIAASDTADKQQLLQTTDSLIKAQEAWNTEHHVRNTYSIEHVFSIGKDDRYTLYEVTFFLSSNLKVRDVFMSINAKLSDADYQWFLFFYSGKEIFNSGNYEEDLAASKAFYDHYTWRFGNFDGDRNELVFALIQALRVSYKAGKYDVQEISKAVVINWILRRNDAYPGYVGSRFSALQEIYAEENGQQELLGYSVFHEFIVLVDGKSITQCLYFEMDKWFVIAGTMVAEEPFDRYFEKEGGKN
jgi:hypothetical protein